MTDTPSYALCWVPLWNEPKKGIGLEHLVPGNCTADSVILGFDENGDPFRLTYWLTWDEDWQLREAELTLTIESGTHSLSLQTDGQGEWRHSGGPAIPELTGCQDIDIWPTPFTNSFPILREPLEIGERREFRMAWVDALKMTVQPQPQAYTRLADSLYLFESLDGSGFKAELPVDENNIVLDYPGLFRRVAV